MINNKFSLIGIALFAGLMFGYSAESNASTKNNAAKTAPGSGSQDERYAREDLIIYNTYSGDPGAVEKLELRSLGGDEAATYDLFVLNYRGYIVSKNIPRSKKLLNACKSDVCNQRKGTLSNDEAYSKAIEEVPEPWRSTFSNRDIDRNGLSDDAEKEAKEGNRFAQLKIGKELYAQDSHAKKRQGFQLIEMASQQGLDEAIISLAEIYEAGGVIQPNKQAAIRWYREIILKTPSENQSSNKSYIKAKERIDALTKLPTTKKPSVKHIEKLPSVYTEAKYTSIGDTKIGCSLWMPYVNTETATGYKTSAANITDKASRKIIEEIVYIDDLGWSCMESDNNDILFRRRLATISPFPQYTDIIWSVNKKSKSVLLVSSDYKNNLE